MLLVARLLALTLLNAAHTCRPYGSQELLHFSKEGNINIGGIFSFHQNPSSVNPSLQVNPGQVRCEG